MKCDLHVHSIHSGMCTTPILSKFCRESYSQPEQVYATLKQKGMDLVTLTDHDSIEGAESLRRYPDFFVSEEVTCTMPTGTTAHIGVYNLTERQHIEIQKRRNDLPSLLAYLSEARLFFAINHVFSALTGPRVLEDFTWFEEYFPAFEVQNGQMPSYHNRHAEERAQSLGKTGIGGSDAHVVASAGSSYTDVPKARNAHEFFRDLRAGNGVIGGGNGGYLRLTRDVLWIAGQAVRDNRTAMLLAPLIALVPVVTAAVLIHEMAFARHWSRQVRATRSRRPGNGGRTQANRLVEGFAWP